MDEGIPGKLLGVKLEPSILSKAARIFEDFSLIEEAANCWAKISQSQVYYSGWDYQWNHDLKIKAASELARLGYIDESRTAWKKVKEGGQSGDLKLAAKELEKLGFEDDAAELWQMIAIMNLSELENNLKALRSRIIHQGTTRFGRQDDLFWEPIKKSRLESWVEKRLDAVDELKRLKQTEKLRSIVQNDDASADVRKKAEKALLKLK